MNDPLKSFGGIATGLARNPLGIIALFIVLVYGFASLVTAFGQALTPAERLPLIYFMVIFPVLVLGVFAWLVARHSSDLFAPSDFKDQADYVRLQKLKRAQLDELDRDLGDESATLIDAAVEQPETISAEQIHSASKIEVRARALGSEIVEEQLSQLSAEYENLRLAVPPGNRRTRAMTQVLVKMRTLGTAAAHLVDQLKESTGAGDRLAAVAIMQIDPGKADIGWLESRFENEKPFVFYHAAIALRHVTLAGDEVRAAAAVDAARRAFARIKAFPRPDHDTVEVLAQIVGHGDRAEPGQGTGSRPI